MSYDQVLRERERVGSVCSGVGGLDLGFERAGMQVAFQCEIDAYCRAILAQHWPGVPCFEDIREVSSRSVGERLGQVDRDGGEPDAERSRVPLGGSDAGRSRGVSGASRARGRGDAGARGASEPPGIIERVEQGYGLDLLCGGTPCQDLSVAGRRRGLDGERSGLFFEFARIADELVRPGGWLVFENVPGLLSSVGGRDFAIVLATLADIGFHDLAWRVLDSRYFGVPQRRRRVYIVGRRAVGGSARAVLLEPESGGGDFAPSREAGSRVAASLSRGSNSPGVSAPGRRQEDDFNIVSTLQSDGKGRRGHRIDAEGAAGGHLIAPALVKRYAKETDSDATDCLITLRGAGSGGSNNLGVYEHGDAPTLNTGGDLAIAGPLGGGNDGAGRRSGDDPNLVCSPADSDGVRATSELPRRLDDPRPDGPRYAACGNAVTVNVAHWIGERIVTHLRAETLDEASA